VEQNLICISDVDTRALVSYIRDNGAMNAVICTDGSLIEDLKKVLAAVPEMRRFRTNSKCQPKEAILGEWHKMLLAKYR
jgi:carbamoyl-phosphate synthase small subunit